MVLIVVPECRLHLVRNVVDDILLILALGRHLYDRHSVRADLAGHSSLALNQLLLVGILHRLLTLGLSGRGYVSRTTCRLSVQRRYSNSALNANDVELYPFAVLAHLPKEAPPTEDSGIYLIEVVLQVEGKSLAVGGQVLVFREEVKEHDRHGDAKTDDEQGNHQTDEDCVRLQAWVGSIVHRKVHQEEGEDRDYIGEDQHPNEAPRDVAHVDDSILTVGVGCDPTDLRCNVIKFRPSHDPFEKALVIALDQVTVSVPVHRHNDHVDPVLRELVNEHARIDVEGLHLCNVL